MKKGVKCKYLGFDAIKKEFYYVIGNEEKTFVILENDKPEASLEEIGAKLDSGEFGSELAKGSNDSLLVYQIVESNGQKGFKYIAFLQIAPVLTIKTTASKKKKK